jgi:hypothetical protein
VVDLAHARFQSFEANLCNTIFGDLPIFIILNKADTGAQSVASSPSAASAAVSSADSPSSFLCSLPGAGPHRQKPNSLSQTIQL